MVKLHFHGQSCWTFDDGTHRVLIDPFLRDNPLADVKPEDVKGIEAILLGVLVFIAFVQIMAMQGVDLSTVIPAERLDLAEAQIEAYWALPWFGAMLGAVERVFAICVQLLLSLLVLNADVSAHRTMGTGVIMRERKLTEYHSGY